MRYDYTSMGFITFDCLGWPFTGVPDGGGCAFLDDFTLAVSGAAGGAAIAASRMGLRTRAIGGVGADPMGDWVLQRLAHFGVDTSGMQQRPDWRTSSSIVTTRADGTRPALHRKGATSDFFVDDDLLPAVIDATVVHAGGVGLMDAMDHGRTAEVLRSAQANGSLTTVDVFAGSPDDLPAIAAVLPFTDYFLPSVEEAEALSGLHDHGDMARFFLERGARCCVLTLGDQGAYYHHGDGTRFRIPAFDVAVRCTCGCGDAFNGGFAVALCKGFDPETAIRFAQATSALNASGLGSQAGVESFEHTLAFMEGAAQRA